MLETRWNYIWSVSNVKPFSKILNINIIILRGLVLKKFDRFHNFGPKNSTLMKIAYIMVAYIKSRKSFKFLET